MCNSLTWLRTRNIFKLHAREINFSQNRTNQGAGVNATNPYTKKCMDRWMPNKMFFSCRFCINCCIFMEIKKVKKICLAKCTEDIEAIAKICIKYSNNGSSIISHTVNCVCLSLFFLVQSPVRCQHIIQRYTFQFSFHDFSWKISKLLRRVFLLKKEYVLWTKSMSFLIIDHFQHSLFGLKMRYSGNFWISISNWKLSYILHGKIDVSLGNNFWLPKPSRSAQTVENSHSFFNVSYTWYKSLDNSYYWGTINQRVRRSIPKRHPRSKRHFVKTLFFYVH